MAEETVPPVPNETTSAPTVTEPPKYTLLPGPHRKVEAKANEHGEPWPEVEKDKTLPPFTIAASQTQYQLSQDTAFRQRVEIQMLTQTINVMSELNTVVNHVNRCNYGKLITNNPSAYGALFAEACATQNDPGTGLLMTSAITDANLANVISSVYNALAGVI